MVRAMDRIIFVYRCEACFEYYLCGAGDPIRCPLCDSKERNHVSTVDAVEICRRVLKGDNVLPELRGDHSYGGVQGV